MSNRPVKPVFEELYREERSLDALPPSTPWDIGGPQPVVQELVAYGALRGEVLDPGTGPGHHAIYYASRGYSTTGIDASPAAIERAKRNAQTAGVAVDFQVGDVTKLDGYENRFDTVVDAACYHTFLDDEDTQKLYAQTLHRATKPGARLFMFEFGRHNVNGVQLLGLPPENFARVLSASGWRIDYVGNTTYRARFDPEVLAKMSEAGEPKIAALLAPMQDQLQVIAPLLENHLVHLPFWAVHATRID
ncbi:methyltransferase [Rhodococcus sp. WMMA185]|uniref:class I SAM-dependent methyltransferase n=1 Tax=Rhodococcus sp. WMMA185 TaxID=679318 RepID=UPI000878974D|nr:class I SAM-dependent methyltransferase [Rhodococcus sp. WMMA185]AOW93250.1 methyltransferase [Rhodococcus sp. WMMA185]